MQRPPQETIGVLTSGGLDSCVLVGHYLEQRRRVQPIYIRTGLQWQSGELPALLRFLAAIATNDLAELVVLDLPLGDLYQGHWSTTGRDVPNAESPDEAVFLPGRNALLLVKAAVWCQLQRIEELALAPLGTSPFADAGSAFFRDFQAAINHGSPHKIKLARPFGEATKNQVMELGRHLPLELTFSCIAPVGELHCGHCNKCAERQTAFRNARLPDRTTYANLTPEP